MDFVYLSTLCAMTGTILMLFIYVYLYGIYRESHMGAWILGWLLHFARIAIFDCGILDWKNSMLNCIAYQMFYITCATVLLYSAYLFIKKSINKFWLYGAAFTSILSISFTLMKVSVFWKLVPPAWLSAIMLFDMGRIFICRLQIKGVGNYITGYAFILWGICTATVPFLFSDMSFPRWVISVAGILRLVIASGILLVYFEKTRADLITKEEHFGSLQQANRELDNFCHSVSHDLKAPLLLINKLCGYLARDHSDKLDDNGHELIGHIQDKSVEVINITNHLLELSKMAKMPIEVKNIPLEPLFREVYDELIKLQPERQVDFKIKQLPVIRGDLVMIKLLVHNILSNALKFTRNREQAVIEVETKEADDYYIISVKDNGAGFDMRYSSRLFGVFERLHSDNEFEGAGVGLTISQKILKRHNGKAWLTGKVDEGAVFSFSFPKNLQEQHTWPVLVAPDTVS